MLSMSWAVNGEVTRTGATMAMALSTLNVGCIVLGMSVCLSAARITAFFPKRKETGIAHYTRPGKVSDSDHAANFFGWYTLRMNIFRGEING